jgi:phosphoribosylanthranilate isomerase
MVRVKICGITRVEDAFAAIRSGADALGFVFYKKSPRYISPSKAKRIIDALPPFISITGVFVNERQGAITDIAGFCGLDAIQLHGDEDQHECHRLKRYGLKIIKGFRVGDNFNFEAVQAYKVDAHLFDAYDKDSYGGTGKVLHWDLLKDHKSRVPVILSGGLTPDNVREAVQAVHPYAVDVSSGVEKKPGIKDPELIQRFIWNLQSV